MKETRPQEKTCDREIREIFKDDLSPAIDKELRKEARRMREDIVRSDSVLPFHRQRRRIYGIFHALRKRRIVSREVLAVACLLMVVLGGYLYTNGYQNSLSLSTGILKTAITVSDRIRHCSTMECRVQLYGRDRPPQSYIIRWDFSGRTRLDFQNQEKGIDKTAWISGNSLILVDHNTGTMTKEHYAVLSRDPGFKPVLDFLSPAMLLEIAEGGWRREGHMSLVPCDQETYAIASAENNFRVEMTVDLCSYLPQHVIKRIFSTSETATVAMSEIQVHFIWNTPISPELMIPAVKEG